MRGSPILSCNTTPLSDELSQLRDLADAQQKLIAELNADKEMLLDALKELGLLRLNNIKLIEDKEALLKALDRVVAKCPKLAPVCIAAEALTAIARAEGRSS